MPPNVIFHFAVLKLISSYVKYIVSALCPPSPIITRRPLSQFPPRGQSTGWPEDLGLPWIAYTRSTSTYIADNARDFTCFVSRYSRIRLNKHMLSRDCPKAGDLFLSAYCDCFICIDRTYLCA